MEDRKRQLDHSQSEIQRVDTRIEEVAVQYKEVEKKVTELQKKEKVRLFLKCCNKTDTIIHKHAYMKICLVISWLKLK